jgi:hypothetical protein
MTESEAEYFQARKDDEDEWGPGSSGVRRGDKRLDAIVSVRFSPDEESALRARAVAEGTTLSGLIRRAALGSAPVGLSVRSVAMFSGSRTIAFGGTISPTAIIESSPDDGRSRNIDTGRKQVAAS